MNLTDPATELGHLIDWLLKQPVNSNPTCDIISSGLGLSSQSSDYAELIAAVAVRLQRMREFVSLLEPQGILTPDEIDDASSALDHLQGAVLLQNQGRRWDQIREQHVRYQDGFTLFKLGHKIRPFRPLRIITAAERAEALQEMARAHALLSAADDFDAWLKQHLVESLERLTLTLRHLQFFGYTAGIREIAGLKATIEAARPKLTGKKALAALATLAAAISTASALYTLPTDVQEGSPFWQKTILSIAADDAPKLLSGPPGSIQPKATP